MHKELHHSRWHGDGRRRLRDGCGGWHGGGWRRLNGWERRLAWGGTISYSAAISACEKGQEWQPAVGLLSTMAIAKVEANTISYITVRQSVRGKRD